MKIIDWTISRLSKSQDEMFTLFKTLTADNIEIVLEGVDPIIRHGKFTFLIIDNNVILKDTETGKATTAFLGIRSTIKNGILDLIKNKKEKKSVRI